MDTRDQPQASLQQAHLIELLRQQLYAAQQAELHAQRLAQQQSAQIRKLTALVEGMQRQLATALTDLNKALAQLAAKKKNKANDGEPGAPPDAVSAPEEAAKATAAPDAAAPPSPQEQTQATPKRKPRRAPLPAHLPRHLVEMPVHACQQCGSDELDNVGEGEVSERYDYVPASIRVERLVRQTCRCRRCGAFTTAAMPPVPVPGGIMTASLFAHIAYSKCCMHLTLDRIAEDLCRLGLELSSATMSDAMGHVGELLEPVCEAIVDDLFASGLVHLDGTGVKVLMPKKKGSYRGQFTVISNAEATAYFFSESKGGAHLARFLRVGTPRAYTGYLVADAASNMDRLYHDGSITECGCWYHARDNFDNAKKSAPYEAAEAMAWITALFEIEHEADAAGDSDAQRLARRQAESSVVLEEMYAWMARLKAGLDPGEELYKAIAYCTNHRVALARFLCDGRIPLTNNQAERDLGPIGRGRKAWLFLGSDQGGERMARIYTVIGTCLRLDIDPRAYLTSVLPRLSTMRANRGRGQLLHLVPKGWKAAQQSGPDPPAAP